MTQYSFEDLHAQLQGLSHDGIETALYELLAEQVMHATLADLPFALCEHMHIEHWVMEDDEGETILYVGAFDREHLEDPPFLEVERSLDVPDEYGSVGWTGRSFKRLADLLGYDYAAQALVRVMLEPALHELAVRVAADEYDTEIAHPRDLQADEDTQTVEITDEEMEQLQSGELEAELLAEAAAETWQAEGVQYLLDDPLFSFSLTAVIDDSDCLQVIHGSDEMFELVMPQLRERLSIRHAMGETGLLVVQVAVRTAFGEELQLALNWFGRGWSSVRIALTERLAAELDLDKFAVHRALDQADQAAEAYAQKLQKELLDPQQ